MTLWIGNGAVLKRSSQLQLKEFRKLNNSGHELLIFKILLIAIDWNFLDGRYWDFNLFTLIYHTVIIMS